MHRETVERVLQNILIYLDVLKPRTFDAEDLSRELPQDVTFVYCNQAALKNASETGKLMVKDFKDLPAADAFSNLQLMFTMLQSLLKPLPNMTLARTSYNIVGKLKKGMPGSSQFGLQVEVQVSDFFSLFRTIFSIEVPAVTRVNQVSGLPRTDYQQLVN